MSKMSKLLGQLDKAKKGSFEKDAETYYPERDKAGNGYAVLRFLPGKNDDAPYFVKSMKHFFKGPNGRWFSHLCPTTLGKECPACEANGELVRPYGDWEKTPESVKTVVRERKRKIEYFCNVLVLEDPAHPENEGKVFLFKFGESILDMITAKAQPPAAFKQDPVDVFDLETGCDFEFRIRKVKNQTNYESSTWRASSDRTGEVDLSQLTDLEQFVAPEKFKSYEELSDALSKVIGGVPASKGELSAERAASESAPAKAAPARTSAPAKTAAAAPVSGDDTEQDIMAMMNEITGATGDVDDDIPF